MSQSAFANALLNPDFAPPMGITDPQGRAAPKRFNVYRNNVTTGLGKTLEAGFPAVMSLVGVDFFRAAAIAFLRRNPPQSRIMMLYGADFPAFLSGFAPAKPLGYLPDVARLEQALRESYHAVDTTPIAADRLAALPESRLLAARFCLAPSLRLITSPWPILSIWRSALHAGPSPQMSAQEVAILRPEFDPAPCLLPQGAAAFLAALQAERPLIAALSEAGAGFDLTATLTLLIQHKAIVEIIE